MHGRLKVKTTAEQQEAKRKEREKKLQLYTAGTKRAFQKRGNEEYDEEALSITGDLLSANPDFYSLWNFRKEIFKHFKKEKSEDELQKLLEGELQFLEGCLRVNPKSYGSWQHRCFTMENMPKPDWQNELELCNKYLEHDERNFHCWDYRRFVVKNHQVSPQDEFLFTTEKISTNFSNFSSWHYRSQLLPQLHPDPNCWAGIEEKVLLQELELVQNAFFTDPNDQSAWFYHMWLLGSAKQKLDIQHLQIVRKNMGIYAVLTQAIKIGEKCQLTVNLNGLEMEGKWTTPDGYGYSKTWVWTSAEPLDKEEEYLVTVTIHDGEVKASKSCQLTSGQSDAFVFLQNKDDLTETLQDILTQELDNCSQLHELEPDNKWTMLTIVSLMRRLNSEMYENQIVEYINKLNAVDPMRSSYYEDLKSSIIIKNLLMKLGDEIREINLSRAGLSTLSCIERLVKIKVINLSHNKLQNLEGCTMLQCTQSMFMDDNRLTSTKGLENLPHLEVLSLKDNSIQKIEDLSSLKSCKSLVQISLSGNPVCNLENWKSRVWSLLPGVVVS